MNYLLTVLVIDPPAFMAGYFLRGLRKERRKESVLPPEPLRPALKCDGCGHGYSFHGKDNGPCGHAHDITEQRQVAVRDASGGQLYRGLTAQTQTQTFVVKTVKCTCQRYSGPEPLPTYI